MALAARSSDRWITATPTQAWKALGWDRPHPPGPHMWDSPSPSPSISRPVHSYSYTILPLSLSALASAIQNGSIHFHIHPWNWNRCLVRDPIVRNTPIALSGRWTVDTQCSSSTTTVPNSSESMRSWPIQSASVHLFQDHCYLLVQES